MKPKHPASPRIVADALLLAAMAASVAFTRSEAESRAEWVLVLLSAIALVALMALSRAVERRKTVRERIEESDERAVFVRMQVATGAHRAVMAALYALILLCVIGYAVTRASAILVAIAALGVPYLIGSIAEFALSFRYDSVEAED